MTAILKPDFHGRVLIKFVKAAGMWCKTYWTEKGEQKQTWSTDKPEEKEQ